MLLLLLASTDPAVAAMATAVLERLGFDVQSAGPVPASFEFEYNTARFAVIAVADGFGETPTDWRDNVPAGSRTGKLHSAIFAGTDAPNELDSVIYLKPEFNAPWVEQLFVTLVGLGWIDHRDAEGSA